MQCPMYGTWHVAYNISLDEEKKPWICEKDGSNSIIIIIKLIDRKHIAQNEWNGLKHLIDSCCSVLDLYSDFPDFVVQCICILTLSSRTFLW